MDISNISKKWRILIVFVGYCLLIFLVLWAIDGLILPSITSGTANKTVPRLAGLSLQKAQRTISSKGLVIEIAKEIYNEKAPIGTVITQMPAANSIVKEGRIIYVTVSKGKELVSVPSLSGLQQRAAKINLMKVGLELGKISYEFSDKYGKDTIVAQSSQAGTKVQYGDHINITISKGYEIQIKIPSLIGLSFTEAKELLTELGLTLGTLDYKPDGTYLPDVVINQFPLPGGVAVPEQSVNLTITK
jgi:serine/threonine-protein kinase